jgi:hypothetical protein
LCRRLNYQTTLQIQTERLSVPTKPSRAIAEYIFKPLDAAVVLDDVTASGCNQTLDAIDRHVAEGPAFDKFTTYVNCISALGLEGIAKFSTKLATLMVEMPFSISERQIHQRQKTAGTQAMLA